jgi:pimeloyl-ACP methyl ester carboxylesterase
LSRSPRVDRRVLRAGLALAEVPRATVELAALSTVAPLLAAGRRGDGHPVLVVPGFLVHDSSTRVLRAYLRWLDYSVSGWELGRNLGATESVVDRLRRRLAAMAESSGEKVTIIGWSLGGMYAHELARRAPASVRQVVTLGSPVRTVGGHGRSASARSGRPAGPLRVPATSVYSRSDGIVPWQACRLSPGSQRENIEVFSSHLGLGHHPTVLHLLADRLAQPEHDWKPFIPGRLAAPVRRVLVGDRLTVGRIIRSGRDGWPVVTAVAPP